MIYVTLMGGIGNQLFQYAFAHELALHNDGQVCINKYQFKHATDNHGDYLLDGIVVKGFQDEEITDSIKSERVRLASRTKYRMRRHLVENDGRTQFAKKLTQGFVWSQKSEQLLDSLPDRLKKKKYYVEGYYQWPSLMEDTINYICQHIEYKVEPTKNRLLMLQQIQSSNSVCVHIRRGDYTLFKSLQVCNNDYYYQAMQYVMDHVETPKFFVFSDDIEWVKNNCRFPAEVNFVETSDDTFVDLQLMSSCKHFVISNSTFSWWAQELSKQSNRVVVAPSIWYTDGRPTELLRSSFSLINVEGNEYDR